MILFIEHNINFSIKTMDNKMDSGDNQGDSRGKVYKCANVGRRALLHLFWCDLGYENYRHVYGISLRLLVDRPHLGKIMRGLEERGMVSSKLEECRRDYYLAEDVRAYLQDLYDKTEMKHGKDILSRTRFIEGWF